MFIRILFVSNIVLVCLLLLSCNSSDTLKVNSKIEQNNSIVSTDTIQILESSLIQDSLNIENRLDLALRYYSKYEFEKAIFHFSKIISIDGKNLDAIINIGNVYYDTQQYAKAMEYYQNALVIDDSNINVRCDYATCYLNEKMPEKAIEILNENVKRNFNHAQSHYNLAIIYKQLGKVQESDKEMKIFNSITPN